MRWLTSGSRKVFYSKLCNEIGFSEALLSGGLPYVRPKTMRIHHGLINSHYWPRTGGLRHYSFFSALKYNYGLAYAEEMLGNARVALTAEQGYDSTSGGAITGQQAKQLL